VEISRSEIEEIIRKTNSGRVETKIGVISIETPVRRQFDRMFRYENLKAITGLASENGIKTHLDGARIFVQAVHENRDPADYGQLFDTVYTSMWKCFNAGSGAILAGSKDFTAKLFHERRMFGGGLPASWAFAAVALHYADTFLNDYKTAWQNAEKLLSQIQTEERFSVVRYENGSHVFRLNLAGTNLVGFRDALGKRDIELPAPDEKGFLLKINPSLNRISPQNLAGSFLESLKEQN
jgi:threonine aldolase